jgi:hypothetical protein
VLSNEQLVSCQVARHGHPCDRIGSERGGSRSAVVAREDQTRHVSCGVWATVAALVLFFVSSFLFAFVDAAGGGPVSLSRATCAFTDMK